MTSSRRDALSPSTFGREILMRERRSSVAIRFPPPSRRDPENTKRRPTLKTDRMFSSDISRGGSFKSRRTAEMSSAAESVPSWFLS